MRKSRNKLGLSIDEYDMFGAATPHMTIEGKQVVGTHIGFFATVIVSMAMLAFGCLQAFIVLTHSNPSITFFMLQSKSDAFISPADQLNITVDFFAAITVQNEFTKEIIYDEKLVRFMAVISDGDGI